MELTKQDKKHIEERVRKLSFRIVEEAKEYMKNVIQMLDESGVMQDVDNAALTMLARNYSMFIKASKQLDS